MMNTGRAGACYAAPCLNQSGLIRLRCFDGLSAIKGILKSWYKKAEFLYEKNNDQSVGLGG